MTCALKGAGIFNLIHLLVPPSEPPVDRAAGQMLLDRGRSSPEGPAQQGKMAGGMPQHWIIDVLTDLQGFARQNDMPDLAQHLDQTLALAAAELARSGPLRPEDATAGTLDRSDWPAS